ncbi:rhodanese-like domain-containing protein 7 [Aristolochia californica]|uniref:rhodanese-like domain-containing protein 7 n=1 Tax=Aristolochia californica TaxID=171875 RepID=UPI0035E1B233
MQSPPFLSFRTAAAAAALRLLASSFQNPSSCFLRTMTSTVSQKSLISGVRQKPLVTQNLMSGVSFPASSAMHVLSSTVCGSRNRMPEEEVDSSGGLLIVVSFYKFADFPDHADMRKPLKDLCEKERVSGGIILAPEGINGSICGTQESVEKVLAFIQSDERLNGLRQVECPVSPEEEAIHHGHTSKSPLGAGEDAPFRWDHVRVKVKKEIVTLGMPAVSPIKMVGKYVNPKDWNEVISDPNTMVIDVRNSYETRIGRFKGAVDPSTDSFREFPSWVNDLLQSAESISQQEESDPNTGTKYISRCEEPKVPPPRVAMYCTGGIRCEKASSFLLSKGFKEVYQLEGGILKYLEEVPQVESLWEGECFVFDKRVSVEHGLTEGTFKLCYGCKQPVSDEDMESPEWEYGVTCPYCYSSKSEEEKERARARQRQFETWGVIGGPDKGRRPTTGEKQQHQL